MAEMVEDTSKGIVVKASGAEDCGEEVDGMEVEMPLSITDGIDNDVDVKVPCFVIFNLESTLPSEGG